MNNWSVRESLDLYGVDKWGKEFFSIGAKGHIEVRPHGPTGPTFDLLEMLEDLQGRGLRTPMLIRFSDILASRISGLSEAFARAINQYEYKGIFRGVYPIKVNQQRHVVEEIVAFGSPWGVGLEAGSKPELLIALAELDRPDSFIICNGYKDRTYIKTALLAQRLGRTPIIVIDRFHEIDLIIKTAKELDIRPHLGIRTRLTARGAGRWEESTGLKSKFGLSSNEIVQAVECLRGEDMLDCLELLHFHIGSQITAIRAHSDALREASQVFVGLHQLGARPSLLDVGGGLAVDYDGTQTNSHSSKNYSVQEYANDVVAEIQAACDERQIPHPDLITEAGRWMVAHHSVLVFDILGVNEVHSEQRPASVSEADPKVLQDLAEAWQSVSEKNLLEIYHDTMRLQEDANALFALGQLDLRDRARVEQLFFACCTKIKSLAGSLTHFPEELGALERDLADTYYGNFSLFQSAPDHWAIKHLFPVMPIHRLDEEPKRRGLFADLTCDSDGKIDRFIDQHNVKKVLELHQWNGQPYYVGMFLIGAYQEILGDLHNLFGDTDAVHVRLNDRGRYEVEHVVEGDEVGDVLNYVQYDRKAMIEKVRRSTERAVQRGDLTAEDAGQLRRHYAQGLSEYTYLHRDP